MSASEIARYETRDAYDIALHYLMASCSIIRMSMVYINIVPRRALYILFFFSKSVDFHRIMFVEEKTVIIIRPNIETYLAKLSGSCVQYENFRLCYGNGV